MERRHDPLLRDTVERVKDALEPSGFSIRDRGGLGDFRWVELEQTAVLPTGEYGAFAVVLCHFDRYQQMGGRLEWRPRIGGGRTRQLDRGFWHYTPECIRTSPGCDPGQAAREWATAAVAQAS